MHTAGDNTADETSTYLDLTMANERPYDPKKQGGLRRSFSPFPR